jgi:hypothetical protein
VYNFDFVATYLNAPIDEEVWVKAPEGLAVWEGNACLLDKALYGTKQAAWYWWKHLSTTLGSLGYESSYYDSSVYTLSNKADQSIIWVHVENGIVTGSSNAALKQLEQQLKGSLEIKWKEGLNNMVGVNIKHTAQGFELSQPTLISKILRNQWDGTTIRTTLLPEGFNSNFVKGDAGVNPTEFLLVIGCLSYVSVGTRPNITYAVNCLAHFSSRPLAEHWKALNHLVCYLAGTKDCALKLHLSRGLNSTSGVFWQSQLGRTQRQINIWHPDASVWLPYHVGLQEACHSS